MTNLGYYNFSSSSSSSNLSPLAQPFTVDRSNPNKTPNPNPNPSFNAPLDALNYGSNWAPSYHSPTADSGRTNTVSYDGFGNNDEKSTTRNWVGMSSSVKSGLEGNLYGNVKPTTPWVLHDGSSDEHDLPLVPLGFDMLSGDFGSSPSLFEAKYGGKVDGSRGKEGSPMFGRVVGDRVRENKVGPLGIGKSHDAYPATNHKENGVTWNGSNVPFETRPLMWSSSGDIKSPLINDGSRGKQDSAVPPGFFGDYVVRENNVGPSIIVKSNGAFPAANNGLVSPSISKEHSTTWNGNTSYYETRPFFDDSSSALKSISITKPSPSIVIKPSVTVSSSAKGAVSTKSMDAGTMSPFICNNVLDGNKPLKEQELPHPVGFQFKATSSANNTEDVKSAANLSEHLDHQQAEEDSPCWKGASTHFSLFGSLQAESSQHSVKKVQENDSVNLQLNSGMVDQNMHISTKDAAKSGTAESLDVDHVLKVLSSFSELLVSYCSEDESGLNKQDRKALDHIIGNLHVCMSEKIQQADAAQTDQEQNNNHVDKSIEQPSGDTMRDNDLPKDHNMIQTIKKVLDENLECSEDKLSETMLYKNLWLEAEAELCVSGYRARFNRVKKEMGKPKASDQDVSDASDQKKISTSIFSSPKVIHEAARSKTSNTLATNTSFPNHVEHIVNNDVENSVMARFNILKRREESNSVNMAEKEPGVDVEASIDETENSGVAEASHLQHHFGEADDKFPSASSTVPEDIEHLVMARLNVLKRRGESDSVNFEHQVLADGAHAEASDKQSQSCGLMAGPHFQQHAVKEKEMASDSIGGASLMRNFDSGLYTTYGDAEKGVVSGSVGGTNLMQNWFDPGLYSTYGASSDWEYVQKR